MKKTILEIVQLTGLYAMGVIYGYYNFDEPMNHYSWFICAIILFVIYGLIIFFEKRQKK